MGDCRVALAEFASSSYEDEMRLLNDETSKDVDIGMRPASKPCPAVSMLGRVVHDGCDPLACRRKRKAWCLPAADAEAHLY
eukprot:scaffold5495_cov376-Prasinococcus_capsulatus_cf.AAC.3